jgi:hypothetical protein
MIMQSDIKAFVLLKYKILTSDPDTWELCNTYPPEVRSKWIWRCIIDLEFLVDEYSSAKNCIAVAKKHRDGLATQEEFNIAYKDAIDPYSVKRVRRICGAVNYALFSDAENAIRSLYKIHYTKCGKIPQPLKWKLYIEWLIEELCEYETNHIITA